MASVCSEQDDSNQEDYYTILGLEPTARLIEIKKAFRTLQRKVHPDSSHSSDTRHISAKLNEAYQTLSNSLSRLEYDLKHNLRENNSCNIYKLHELRRRKAEKIRENMNASANRSRIIESNVTSCYSNGKQNQNCGLIITKAKYGLIDQNITKLQRSKTYDSNSIINSNKTKNINTGYDSATESVPNNNIDYTIDVTDALQCMIIHRGQKGGYIEIDDGFNKSDLEGFYNPFYNGNMDENCEKRYLEIEYMFNRKYHYIKANNFEYLCIPNENHIVHLYNIDENNIINESDHENIDEFKDNENIKNNNAIDTTILKSAHSFATFSPIFIQNNMDMIDNYNIITLPSGKTAITSRPSLIGLKTFNEIEKLRNDINNSNINGNNNYKNKIIKYSVVLMVVGAIGGLGYYYVDKQQRKQNKNDNNRIINLWQESILLYVQKYWNWIIGNEIEENDKCTKWNTNDKSE